MPRALTRSPKTGLMQGLCVPTNAFQENSKSLISRSDASSIHLRSKFARRGCGILLAERKRAVLCRISQRAQSRCFAATSERTAKDAVETGLSQFREKQYEKALRLFQEALDSDPRPEEAQAALYNSACCQVKLKQWQAAADSVAEAVNSYNLRAKVAFEDKDLAPLRERREWRDAAETFPGALSAGNLVGIRAEQRSPFRLLRLIVFGGLGTGALVGLLIILSRLVGALKGGEGAPDLTETLQNLAINGAAVAILGFLFQRDLKGTASDRTLVEREERLARLQTTENARQVRLGSDRTVTIDTLRGSVRPVVVSGTRGQVSRSIKAAAPYVEALRERGVSVVPLVINDGEDSDAKLSALKAEFRPSKGFAKKEAPQPSQKAPGPQPGSRFEIQPHDRDEWLAWLSELKREAGVAGEHLYVQIQLDGSVRGSGVGAPPWERFCSDLAPLDSVRTKMTDGMRR